MSEETGTPEDDIMERLRALEGVVFAARLRADTGGPIWAAGTPCTCQNCPCAPKVDGGCGCNPRCTCQGVTAMASTPYVLEAALGAAAILPIEDVQTLVELRDKAKEALRKPPE